MFKDLLRPCWGISILMVAHWHGLRAEKALLSDFFNKKSLLSSFDRQQKRTELRVDINQKKRKINEVAKEFSIMTN